MGHAETVLETLTGKGIPAQDTSGDGDRFTLRLGDGGRVECAWSDEGRIQGWDWARYDATGKERQSDEADPDGELVRYLVSAWTSEKPEPDGPWKTGQTVRSWDDEHPECNPYPYASCSKIAEIIGVSGDDRPFQEITLRYRCGHVGHVTGADIDTRIEGER